MVSLQALRCWDPGSHDFLALDLGLLGFKRCPPCTKAPLSVHPGLWLPAKPHCSQPSDLCWMQATWWAFKWASGVHIHRCELCCYLSSSRIVLSKIRFVSSSSPWLPNPRGSKMESQLGVGGWLCLHIRVCHGDLLIPMRKDAAAHPAWTCFLPWRGHRSSGLGYSLVCISKFT